MSSIRMRSRMAAISRSGMRPATGSVYARASRRLRGFEALQPALGERRDLVDDHPHPGTVVDGGVERGHEDGVEGGGSAGQQPVGDAVHAIALAGLQVEV